MLEHCASLLKSHTREPLNELVNRGVVFKVLKQCRDWHASTPEHPCSTYATGVALDGGACGPVNHGSDGSTGGF